jgi:hypothetical protein
MTEYLVLAQGWITGYVRKRNSVRVHWSWTTLRWWAHTSTDRSHWTFFTLGIIPVYKNIIVRKHGHNSQGQKRGGNSLLAVTYQDLNFFASGISGFTSTVLLPIVDKDTPKTAYKEYITHGNSIQRAHFKWEPMFLSVTYLESPQL